MRPYRRRRRILLGLQRLRPTRRRNYYQQVATNRGAWRTCIYTNRRECQRGLLLGMERQWSTWHWRRHELELEHTKPGVHIAAYADQCITRNHLRPYHAQHALLLGMERKRICGRRHADRPQLSCVG